MKQMKKVLIVSYLFPPIAGGGVPRALKMTKYLPHYGWEVVVLTVDAEYNVSLDESLLKEIPADTPIYRAQEWNPYQRLNRLRGEGSSTPAKSVTESNESTRSSQGLLTQLKRGLFNFLKRAKEYVLIPDDHLLWVPFAIREGLKAIKEEQIDVIFSTSGPYSVHLVAKSLAKRTGIPWIADFRDPWTQNMHRSGIPWRERIEERQERGVMKKADIITTVTQSFANNFKHKFPEIRQIEVIHNGYDPEDYVHLTAQRNPEKMVLSYTGIFYENRNPRLFLQAVAELIAEGKIDRQTIEIRFAGVFDYPGYSENHDHVRKHRLEDVVNVLGYLPYQDSLTLLKASDVLLLIGDTAPGSEAYIPGKLFEYLAIQRPILSLSLPGESSTIVEEFGIGKVIDPHSLHAIKDALFELYEAWKDNRLDETFSFTTESERLNTYRRDIQAQELSELLDELIN